jgi:hypothetical protein
MGRYSTRRKLRGFPTFRDFPSCAAIELNRWRVLLFGFGLILLVVLLLGLLPALRASAVRPVAALKGVEDPHSPRRLMRGAIALQVAFCFLVLFLSSLFVTSFQRCKTVRSVSPATVCSCSKPLPAKASCRLSGIKLPRRSVLPPVLTRSPSRAGPFSDASA